MIQVDENDPIGEVEPSFPCRDVLIRRGVDVKDFYDLQSEIGRGKFGTVFRCRERNTGLQLAAKFVATPRREDKRNVEREVDIMRCLQHARLIQLYDAFDNNNVMCVVLELIEGGELFERVIGDDFVLTEKSCTVFMRQICEGIEFIHQNNILHLDMKPENILCLTRTGNRIKIIDFGLARKYDPQKKLQVLFGTPEFVAPEIVNFDQIGFGTDMWSIGVICYVLLSGLSPFMGETDIETMANVTIAKYDFDDEVFNDISPEAKDFIEKLLIKDKDRRMSANQCLAHDWLKRKPPAPPKPISPTEELDVAKDNLRCFVERWSEHPNSPYLFDITCHTICPRLLAMAHLNVEPAVSQHSLRGLSPSPCGSLSSSPDSVIEHEILGKSPSDTNFLHYTFDNPASNHNNMDMFQSFERRASDSSCVVRHNSDVVGCVNLAEEIRKLSDKLFQMTSLHAASSTETVTSNNINTTTTSKISINNNSNQPISFSNKLQTPKSFLFNNFVSNGQVMNSPFQQGTFTKTTTPLVDDGVKRTKFKMSNLNRDVPIGSPLPPCGFVVTPPFNASPCSSRNSSDTLPSYCSASSTSTSSLSTSFSPRCSPDLESPPAPLGATDTKNLLLKLLTKWDDKQTVNTASSVERTRQSFSIDWSEEESLGQRSMNSLATFFQSSRSDVEKKRSVIPP